MSRGCIHLRPVLPDPEYLGRGETGERGVARQLDEPLRADGVRDLSAFLRGALVVPQDGGPKDAAALVKAHEAVHLPA